MNVSFGRLAIAAVALATIGYGLVEFRGPNGYAALMEKRREMDALNRENKVLRDEIRRLDTRIDKLNKDPETQELEIRKRLGLVRPGETVYVLQDAKQTTSKASK
jgi:cell division protein FtsB